MQKQPFQRLLKGLFRRWKRFEDAYLSARAVDIRDVDCSAAA